MERDDGPIRTGDQGDSTDASHASAHRVEARASRARWRLVSECDRLKCEQGATVTFEGFDGEERAWCRECYDEQCSR